MGGLVLGILVWQEGGEAVGAFLAVGAMSLASLAWWLVRRKREGKLPLIDPDLFRSKMFRLGISGQTLQQIALGGAMIALPIFLQMVLEYNALQAGLSLAPLSLSMFAVATLAGKRAGDRRPASIIRIGFLLLTIGIGACIPSSRGRTPGLWFAIPLVDRRLGSGPAGVPAQQLHPRADLRGAHQRGCRGQLGRWLVRAVVRPRAGRSLMLASLAFAFTELAESSTVLPPAEQQVVAAALDEDAQLMSNTALDALIVNQPPEIEAEIIRINTEARPIALQVALLVPLLAGLLGLITSFRMMRLPDVKPSADLEGLALG